MSLAPETEFSISDLPLDVFELSGSGLEVESLTAGHGMVENGASSACSRCSCTLLQCSCCTSGGSGGGGGGCGSSAPYDPV